MSKQNDNQDTEERQPRPVFYEPHHAAEVTEQIRLALALRGYELTRDEDAMPDDGAWAMVTESPDGSLTLLDGDPGIHLPPVEAFETPAAYAGAIASWLDGGDDDVVDPTERERDEWPHYELTAPMIGDGGQADELHFLVGHWAKRDSEDRTLTGQTPGAIRAEAMGHIDAMLDQLQQLRTALIREGREYQDSLLDNLDATYGKPGESRA